MTKFRNFISKTVDLTLNYTPLVLAVGFIYILVSN